MTVATRPGRGRLPIDWVALLLLGAVLVTLTYPRIAGFPYGLMEDDSYFYAQIAYNIGTTGRSTLDGIYPTDGYHLLWGGMLAALAWATNLVTDSKDAHLGAFLTLSLWLSPSLRFFTFFNIFFGLCQLSNKHLSLIIGKLRRNIYICSHISCIGIYATWNM